MENNHTQLVNLLRHFKATRIDIIASLDEEDYKKKQDSLPTGNILSEIEEFISINEAGIQRHLTVKYKKL